MPRTPHRRSVNRLRGFGASDGRRRFHLGRPRRCARADPQSVDADHIDAAEIDALKSDHLDRAHKMGDAVVAALTDMHDAFDAGQRKALTAYLRARMAAWNGKRNEVQK